MTSPDDDDEYASPRITSRVGADLRAARERVGWTLPAVSAHLRIRLPFLEAIEEGRIGDLPGNAYAVGFLRTYATALGLDPDEIARRFKSEAAEVNRKTELTFPAPVPERGVPAGAVVLVGAIVAIGGYVGWYRVSGTDRPTAELVQPVPDRLAPLAATIAPTPPPPPQASPSQDGDTMTPPPSPAPTAVTALIPLPAAPSAPVYGPPPPPAIAAQLALSASPAPAAAPSPWHAIPGVPDGTRIVIRAKAEAWMQVRDKQGTVLLNRVLRPGEIWPVPTKGPLTLTTGNAAGTELLVDGSTTPPLGGDGGVRRDLPLDPDAVREGKLGPQAVSAPAPRPGLPVVRTN